ncbi:MAG: hypothetical protein ACR2J8_08700, partial [Thermomicrobiales bacterium]
MDVSLAGVPRAGRQSGSSTRQDRSSRRGTGSAIPERLRLLASRAAIGLAVALLTALAVMLYVRVAHAGRFYP